MRGVDGTAAARPERGLLGSRPRFALTVALLAAVTTGPSAALAIAGYAALESTNPPATTPVIAGAPDDGAVVVPDTPPPPNPVTADTATEPLVAQREAPGGVTTAAPVPGWLTRAV